MIKSLPRINELSKKARLHGLTHAETKEQQALRSAYLQAIRGQIEMTVTHMTVIDPLGKDVTPAKVKALK